MDGFHVSLFGKFRVRVGNTEALGFERLKVQELFCYLLLYRERPHPREVLAGLFWGDNSTQQAKRYLSKTLWQLQTALAAVPDGAGGEVLLVESEWIRLNLQANLWLDTASFEAVYRQVQDQPGWNLPQPSIDALESALDWYVGDLLEGWFQDWCLCERERMQHIYLTMLEKLIRSCEARGLFETAQNYAFHLLRYDRTREAAHRHLMRLYCYTGNRAAAIRQYRLCCLVLHDELGVEPSQRTRCLYEKICADQLPQPGHTSTQDPGNQPRNPAGYFPDPGSADLPELLNQLRSVRRTMGDLRLSLDEILGPDP